MATNIDRASDGTVTFDFGVGIDPIVLTDSNNIVVSSEETKDSLGTIIRQDISFMRSNPYFFYATTYSQIGTINGADKPAIGEDTTTLLQESVFQGTSSGGGSVDSVTGNLVTGTGSNPVVSLIGTPSDIVTFDDDGNPEVKPIGITQLTDIASFPPFANGVFVATAMNPVDKTGLLLFIEFSTTTPKSGTFPTYNTGGVLPVANGAANGDAVNLSQLNGRLSANQRTAINALVAATATTEDIVNALKAV